MLSFVYLLSKFSCCLSESLVGDLALGLPCTFERQLKSLCYKYAVDPSSGIGVGVRLLHGDMRSCYEVPYAAKDTRDLQCTSHPNLERR